MKTQQGDADPSDLWGALLQRGLSAWPDWGVPREKELAGNWEQMLQNTFSAGPKGSPRVWGAGWGHGASGCLHCPRGAATATNPISLSPDPKRAGQIQLDEGLQSFAPH